jgi:hypothetical protein
MCEIRNLTAFGRAPGRLAGICEEAHRRTRADQDQVLRPFHEFNNLFGEIRNAFDLHAPDEALAERRHKMHFGRAGIAETDLSSNRPKRRKEPLL